MSAIYPINPRVRAYGKARIDIARRVKDPGDWEKLWLRPANPFPFVWGESWKHCVEYCVDDYPAEVGFFIDVLGLEVNAFDPAYAMFTSPQGDFFLAVVPAHEGHQATPPDALRVQFMVADILSTTRDLEKRGILFDQPPQAIQSGSSLYISTFHTPHGIPIDLWGTVKVGISNMENTALLTQANDEDDHRDDKEDQPLEGEKYREDDEGEPIDDEDTDVDETGVNIADEDEDEDEDEEDLVFNEGEDDDDDELLEYEDEDLEDDDDDPDFDEDDEFGDDDDTEDRKADSHLKSVARSSPSPSQGSFHAQPAPGTPQASIQPVYISLDAYE